VLLLNGDQLCHGAAPSLPEAYCKAIDGVKIGPSVGSCGTVAYSRKRYVAEDINTDAKWADYKALALGHDLQACWSSPIKSTQGDILGTFAVYYGYPNSPSEAELKVIDRFTHLTSLAIEKHGAFNREVELNNQLQLSHSKIETITAVLPDLLFVFDEDGNCVDSYGVDTDKKKVPSKKQLGRMINSLDSGVEHCTCQEAIAKTLQASQMQIFEYQLTRMSTTYYYESRITPLQDYDSNGTNYVLWLARDITDRK
jgi:GAF domain-containing protein